ncbi:hypothetical protein DFP72DRAFT_874112 [Ephemerocybe angulata]|uniref:F-box domain-containing protein n=1 Tax=Ephemerocybe angulata TaxID=980116 RepID=A0A8H6IH35_9AGAR|nr:hypothetical protein DFP72DRAFT_874112 [Tulosesus angulatus]
MDDIDHDVERLARNDEHIGAIQASLHALQGHQQHLVEENAKLRSNIAAKSVPNAPMRTLVVELCSLIFAFAVCANAEANDAAVPECSPLDLAHVCRRWRSIVFDSPHLWTDLRVNLSKPRLNLIPFWFQNASAVPLRVSVFPGIARPPILTSSNPFKKVDPAGIKDLVPYLHRIQTLSLHVHQSALPLLFPRGTVSDMAQLECLSIHHHGYILDEFEIGKIHAPRLRVLRLCDPSPFANMLFDSLAKLKVLRIDKIEFWEYPRRVPALLSSCVELEDVSIVFPRNLYLTGPDPVVLPLVSKLTLEWRFPCNPTPIFSSVRAPLLRDLTFTHNNPLASFSQEAVTTLQDLIQSSPLLTTLTLVGSNLTSICELSSIFYHAPALEELGLVNCHGTGRLLSDLSPAEWEQPSTWLCPQLERIRLAGVRDNDVRSLISFVSRRMKPVDGSLAGDGHFIKEVIIDSRIQDFSTQGRMLILRGLSIITPTVKVTGPLDHIHLASPFNSPVPKN